MKKLEVIQYTTLGDLREITVHDPIPRIVVYVDAIRPMTIQSPKMKYVALSLSTNRGKVCNLMIYNNNIEKFIDAMKLRKLLMIENVLAIPILESLRWGSVHEASFDIALQTESIITNFGNVPGRTDFKLMFEEE